MQVNGLFIYPVKSLGGIAVHQAVVNARGLMVDEVQDRMWMLVDDEGRFITQRDYPSLAALQCRIVDKMVLVTAPQGQSVTLNKDQHSGERMEVQVWNDQAPAMITTPVINDFFSSYLGMPVRLVYFGDGERLTKEGEVRAGQSFSDGYPMLVTNTASLDDVNKRIGNGANFGMERFRPNIVIKTNEPWAEDEWQLLQAGHDVQLAMAKPCPRCVMTTIDQNTGQKTGDEPLRTLTKFRMLRTPAVTGTIFGQNAMGVHLGTLNIGDDVRVLNTQARPPFGSVAA